MLVLLAIFASFDKPDLGNVSWACWALVGESKGWTTSRYRLAIISLGILLMLDLVWIFADTELLVFEIHSDPTINTKRFSFIMGFFNFVIKILMFPVSVRCYLISKENDSEAVLKT